MSRSTALLRSLSVERQRWETGSNAFQTQMGTIVGDVLLSSAFLAYAGKKTLVEFSKRSLPRHEIFCYDCVTNQANTCRAIIEVSSTANKCLVRIQSPKVD